MTTSQRRIVYALVGLDLGLWATISLVVAAIHAIGALYLLIVPRLLPLDAPTTGDIDGT